VPKCLNASSYHSVSHCKHTHMSGHRERGSEAAFTLTQVEVKHFIGPLWHFPIGSQYETTRYLP